MTIEDDIERIRHQERRLRFERGKAGHEMEGLEHDAQVIAAQVGKLVAVKAVERSPVEHHRTRSRALEAREQEQQRGLARAGRPRDRDPLTGADVKIDLAKDVDARAAQRVMHAESV